MLALVPLVAASRAVSIGTFGSPSVHAGQLFLLMERAGQTMIIVASWAVCIVGKRLDCVSRLLVF